MTDHSVPLLSDQSFCCAYYGKPRTQSSLLQIAKTGQFTKFCANMQADQCLCWVHMILYVLSYSGSFGLNFLIPPTYEPPHDKTNKIICASSEDSDQPGHPPSLIRVFAVRSEDSQGPKVSSCRRMPRESSLGSHAICWFCHKVAHMMLTSYA